MTGADVLVRDAVDRFDRAGIASPRADAELLLAFLLDVPRSEVVRRVLLCSEVPEELRGRWDALVVRRAARVPLQHLTGRAAFRHVDLEVGAGVFVPRPETEVVAGEAIDAALRVNGRAEVVVVDLCAGSGAIALAVADEVPSASVHAVELDQEAYGFARRNVAAQGDSVRLVRGDARTAFADLDGRVDVVVSNPPYVPSDAVPKDPEVARHDPGVALYGLGADGFEVPRGITAAAARLLRPGGVFVMEHAEVQADLARRTAADAGLVDVRTLDDLTGRPRAVVARQPDVKD
ncbi:release factor glutamine methyltransferase [Paraoerskovia marina]|uniref:Release factor glutamine methyltransferase n=1 Tax=Paraoerskovia marina TaxID=545619 RepID=A0A1H1R3U6_9CELL|nr:peptide chain release factor N(5)-glutamine methyltransferase [Paraoerskovia marina]SDS30320.1 release factor glutamine methyltransferase [Paraoerskovia marina]